MGSAAVESVVVGSVVVDSVAVGSAVGSVFVESVVVDTVVRSGVGSVVDTDVSLVHALSLNVYGLFSSDIKLLLTTLLYNWQSLELYAKLLHLLF